MAQLLGLLILSFFITSLLLVPFIDFLYKFKLKRLTQQTRDVFEKPTPIFDKLHSWKVGTPTGGGLLIILVVSILTLWAYGLLGLKTEPAEIFVLLFTFISFGILGLLDDIKKTFKYDQTGFFGLRIRHKLLIQVVLATVIGFVLYNSLSYNFIYIHWLGRLDIGFLFVPLAAFVIVSFTNAFNISDGLDGLSSGLLVICLGAFWVIAATILDPNLAIFIAIWIGSLIAFLYFNVYPARLWLGDVGALSFGATLAVVGLLTGKIIALGVIGGIFVVEVLSSLLQLGFRRYYGKKLFPVAPLHLWLQHLGWEEPKIVMRAWLAGLMLAIFGVWLAVI